MNDIYCPYDEDSCPKKDAHFNEWRNSVFKDPFNAVKQTKDMFDGCPIKNHKEREIQCDRYRRYCTIVSKVMDRVEQTIIKMGLKPNER